MAIIKYKDKDGNLQPLGATGDHSHSLESLGAAAEKHSHDVASIENNTNGFMSVEDKQEIVDLHDTVFGNVDEKIVGLVEKIGTDSVSAQISTAVANMVTKDGDKVLSDNNYTDDDKDKLGKIAPGAEVNQNAFATITVGETKIEANTTTDNITLTAGENITLTPDATNKTVTIIATDTTYKEATKDNAGLMSATDKAKLDGVEEGATKVIVDNTLNDASANAIQNKVVTDEIKDINTKFTNLVGTDSVSSQISNALNALKYAGSNEVGGSAISAEALTSKSVGDTAQPVYFGADGKPTVINCTIKTSVPEKAVFTDTTYSAGDGIALSDDNKFSNSGVRSVSEGSKNGTISVNTNGDVKDVAVKGLGSAAYTSADAYDKAKAAESALESAKAHTDKKFTDLVGTTKVSEQISGALNALTYAGSSAVGGAADSANKVNKSLTIQLNNGATEGTNKFTFDGSDAKTINITPSSIGAAANSSFKGASSTQNGASGLVPGPTSTNAGQFLRGDGTWATPTNTKNTAGTTSTTNTKLYLVGATSQGTTSAPTAQTYTNAGVYIDSSNNLCSNGKKVSVDGHNHDDIYYTDDEIDNMFSNKVGTDSVSSQISTAISSHSHKYAGSSTAGGAADEAKKVSNSLVVKLNNGTTANTDYFTFNGSSAKTINITPGSIGAATTSTFSTSGNGLVPKPSSTETGKFLQGNGTWATPTNTTYSTFSTTASGLVPKSTSTSAFLRGDGSWATPTDTNTHYTSSNVVTNSDTSVSDANNVSNGRVRINSVENGSVTSSHIIYGSGATTVTTDSDGDIKIYSTGGSYSDFNGSNSGLVPKPTESSAQLFLDATGDWAAPQVFHPSTNTGKLFLTGTSSATQRSFINTHQNCYMQNGYLYSGGQQVSVTGHTHDEYLPFSNPVALGYISVNRKTSTTIGTNSVALGDGTTASGQSSVALGDGTTASNTGACAEGYGTTAAGVASHAEGNCTTASGDYSHAEGNCTTALKYQHAQGFYNSTNSAPAASGIGSSTGTAFVIGNGTSTSKSNAFRVTYEGQIYANSSITSTGRDYAEFFEWQDSNSGSEDRRGYFVTLDGEQIKIAEPDDYILGIISGQPAVIGNGDEDWMGRYILDEFGAFIPEEFEYEEEIHETVIDEETGEARVVTKTVTKTGTKYKENPDYDSSRPYIQRADRPEWDAVGMMGVLSVRDDGTCQVNGYCKVAKGGIATASDSGYRVIKRINDHIVKVVFR